MKALCWWVAGCGDRVRGAVLLLLWVPSPPLYVALCLPSQVAEVALYLPSQAALYVHRVSSSLLDPVIPSFRALSGSPQFSVRRHQFNTDSLSFCFSNSPPLSFCFLSPFLADLGILLPNNQHQQSTSHAPKDVLPSCICADYCAPCWPLLRASFHQSWHIPDLTLKP